MGFSASLVRSGTFFGWAIVRTLQPTQRIIAKQLLPQIRVQSERISQPSIGVPHRARRSDKVLT